MNKTTLILSVVILALLGAVIFLGLSWLDKAKELKTAKGFFMVQQTNAKIVSFTNIFIEKVLKSSTPVSLEDRLLLENSIREIGDQEIISQWQVFLNSKTEAEAQLEVKNLLQILVGKIIS